MNKTKFKKYLKKIKSFEDWIENDEKLSEIENDLLLDYIKKLYESVLDKEDEEIQKTKKKKKKKEDETILEQTIEKEIENEKYNPEKEQAIIENENVVVEKDTPEIGEVDTEEDLPEIKYSDELLSIFEDSQSNELSEKLSKRPLKDLHKAFGINEKIFTIKEIFKGDKNAFEKAIDKFNNFIDFEEAKKYILDELAPVYDWDKPKNIKKIDQFIKTIKRRYLK